MSQYATWKWPEAVPLPMIRVSTRPVTAYLRTAGSSFVLGRLLLRQPHIAARLYEDSADYFELVERAPPGPAEVQSAFTSLPEGKIYEDKFAFVLLDQDKDLFGHLELIRDYPTFGEWWIGILLLAPVNAVAAWGLTFIARV